MIEFFVRGITDIVEVEALDKAWSVGRVVVKLPIKL